VGRPGASEEICLTVVTGVESASQSPRRGVGGSYELIRVHSMTDCVVSCKVSSDRMRVGAALLSCPSDRRHCACDGVPEDVYKSASSRYGQNTGRGGAVEVPRGPFRARTEDSYHQ
jgi:hypothetical protein